MAEQPAPRGDEASRVGPAFRRSTTALLVFLVLLVYAKNSWISEDAYIVFRSVEQLFAGNGPNWNPHERVQAFTSPLWFVLVASIRLLTVDLYLGVTVLSAVLLAATTVVVCRVAGGGWRSTLAVLTLVSSNGFFDFTASGLENGLAYLLLAGLFLTVQGVEDGLAAGGGCRLAGVAVPLLLVGLVVGTRHDLALLVLPVAARLVWLVQRHPGSGAAARAVAVAAVVPASWTVFATWYYGFPFPNTAYAKLATGVPRGHLLLQGWEYLVDSLRNDPVTPVVILVFLAVVLPSRRRGHLRLWGLGVTLNLVYLLWIGGDFMRGRFLSFSFLVATLGLCSLLASRPFPRAVRHRHALLGLAALVPTILLPHTPLNSPLDHRDTSLGIADERGYYFRELSLLAYLAQRSGGGVFPDHPWAAEGRALRGRGGVVVSAYNIGMLGYFAGTEPILIDRNGLADPLLARLPADDDWRIGHFERAVPEGYPESIASGVNRIATEPARSLHDRLGVVTRSDDLWSVDRLREMVRLNLGP